jgi:hypothetical protein
MRVSKIGMFCGLAVVCSTWAADLPMQKAGLWELTTIQSDMPAQTFKLCVDAKTNRSYLDTANKMQKSCSKMETHVSGSTVTKDGVCKVMSTETVTTHGVTTFQGDTAYKAEAHTHWDPPLLGKSDTAITIQGKWLTTACATGMKPGDIMMSDGKIISNAAVKSAQQAAAAMTK